MRIQNTSRSALVVGGVTIESGGMAEVPGWEAEKAKPVIAAWLKQGLLLEAPEPEPFGTDWGD